MINYKIECLLEDQAVKGNASASGDAAYDKEVEDKILTELESGNAWAWCVIQVSAHLSEFPQFVGQDHLGACSYESEEDFKASTYFTDMKIAAKQDLLSQVDKLKKMTNKTNTHTFPTVGEHTEMTLNFERAHKRDTLRVDIWEDLRGASCEDVELMLNFFKKMIPILEGHFESKSDPTPS
jgi:hypothetical protein